MSAHTVITHAQNQGATPARLVMIHAGEGALIEIDSRELPALRAQGVSVDVVEVTPMRTGGVSLAKGTDVPSLTSPRMIVAQTSGMGGAWESRPMSVGRGVRSLRVGVGRVDAAAMMRDAMERPYAEHYGTDDYGWDTYSVRVVTGLRVVCAVEHDGGFFETP